ncbi:DMP19 family protein [Mariniblastus sp.]|nr:DMP19 family protein [Mariniblastus sp.]
MDEPEYKTVHVAIDNSNIGDLDIWEIVDPVWWTADFWSGVEKYRQSVEQFTQEQRLMVTLCLYLSDVKTGGHELYFLSPFGNFWRDVLLGFELLQLSSSAQVLDDALGKFPGIPSDSETDRELEIEKHAIDFFECDSRFRTLNANLRIEQVMTNYARAHPASFYFSGSIDRIENLSPSSNPKLSQ